MGVKEKWMAGEDLEVFDFECMPHWPWYFGADSRIFIRHGAAGLPAFKSVALMRNEPWTIAPANRPALEDCRPISDENVIEYKQPGPALPAEVHNPTKIDPEAAMAAVRSLCG